MADLMQRERKILADAWVQAGWPPEAAAVLASGNDTQLTVQLSAIAAALRAAPEGFVMVPVEPTDEMIEASLIHVPIAKRINPGQHLRIYGARAWDAMLAARPQGVKDAT